MITTEELRKQCLKWWKEVLVAAIDGNDYFPREITRIGRITPKDILNKLAEHKRSIAALQKQADMCGCELVLTEQQFDKIGRQWVPTKIIITNRDIFLQLTGRKKEFSLFWKNYELIRRELPVLKEWVRDNPLRLIGHDTWVDTLKVCGYFLKNPQPSLYIRQLSIDVHTKYIQENRGLIQSLLDYLIPEYIHAEEKEFEKRFHLCYAEPLIRVRFLDEHISPLPGVRDMALPLSEFVRFRCSCEVVWVAENRMNFLTLPDLPCAIAIWSGGGFSVSCLKDIGWLSEKRFYYWGDLDAQGFQILNQFRTYFPTTTAVMMDRKTWDLFVSGSVAGTPAVKQNLPGLSAEEYELYEWLRKNNLRLEQEKIPQVFAEEQIVREIRTDNSI